MASKKQEKNVVVPKTTADLQRIKLEKLMKNPSKEVIIPERPKDWQPKGPQEFIRNVWGSSAGAGSGDFHVYRGIRRREYARQKFLGEKTARDGAETEYQNKVEQNKRLAEEKTAKKRAKRLKKKQRMKQAKKQKVPASQQEDTEESNEDTDEEMNTENSDVRDTANKSDDGTKSSSKSDDVTESSSKSDDVIDSNTKPDDVTESNHKCDDVTER